VSGTLTRLSASAGIACVCATVSAASQPASHAFDAIQLKVTSFYKEKLLFCKQFSLSFSVM